MVGCSGKPTAWRTALSSPYTSVGGAVDETVFGGFLDVTGLILDAGWAWAAVAVVLGSQLPEHGGQLLW